MSVLPAEVLFVLRAAQAVDELSAVEAGILLFDLILVVDESDGGHLRDEATDRAAIAADREVLMLHEGCERDAVGLLEGALEESFGDLEADEVAVVLLGVTAVCYLARHRNRTRCGCGPSCRSRR